MPNTWLTPILAQRKPGAMVAKEKCVYCLEGGIKELEDKESSVDQPMLVQS